MFLGLFWGVGWGGGTGWSRTQQGVCCCSYTPMEQSFSRCERACFLTVCIRIFCVSVCVGGGAEGNSGAVAEKKPKEAALKSLQLYANGAELWQVRLCAWS